MPCSACITLTTESVISAAPATARISANRSSTGIFRRSAEMATPESRITYYPPSSSAAPDVNLDYTGAHALGTPRRRSRRSTRGAPSVASPWFCAFAHALRGYLQYRSGAAARILRLRRRPRPRIRGRSGRGRYRGSDRAPRGGRDQPELLRVRVVQEEFGTALPTSDGPRNSEASGRVSGISHAAGAKSARGARFDSHGSRGIYRTVGSGLRDPGPGPDSLLVAGRCTG